MHLLALVAIFFPLTPAALVGPAIAEPHTTPPVTSSIPDVTSHTYHRASLLVVRQGAASGVCSAGEATCGSGCMPATGVCCGGADTYCDSGYTCVSRLGGGCVLSNAAVNNVTESSPATTSTRTTSASASVSSITFLSSVSSPSPATSATSAAATASTATGAATSSTPTTSETTPPALTEAQQGLPSATVAGIAVGSALGGIAVALVGAYYLVYRRRFTERGGLRRKQRLNDNETEENPFARKELDGKAILGVVEIGDVHLPKVEAGGRELPASPFELGAESRAAELGVSVDDKVEVNGIEKSESRK